MIEQTENTNEVEQDNTAEVQKRLNELDPAAVPSRIGVYDKPDRRLSPVVLVTILILLFIAAYIIYQVVM